MSRTRSQSVHRRAVGPLRSTFAGLAAIATVLAGCTSATEAFCRDLESNADLSSLTASLDAGDLSSAKEAADDFIDMAERAPEEIRADMREIADGIAGIVALLEQDRRETSVSEQTFDSTSETEQLRTQLNERSDDLDRRSARIETWAVRNCGLDLS